MIPIRKEDVLVEPKDVKPTSKDFEVIGTFNPAAARLPNGDIALYVRVTEKLIKNESEEYYFAPRFDGEKSFSMKLDRFNKKDVTSKSNVDIQFKDYTKRLFFISHLRRVILDKTGFKIKSIDHKPTFSGLINDGELGIEDPRIVKLGDRYAMTYVSLSRQENLSSSLALSDDCINWERKGAIFSEQNKDVVLYPEMVRGNYFVFNRPEGGFEFTPPHMWMASSKDLVNWGKNRPLELSKKGHWDYERIGAGAPPVRTDDGWLLLYHGVIEKSFDAPAVGSGSSVVNTTSTYEVGAALFDLKNPRKLIAKSNEPIISPKKKYEQKGFVNNVIFPTGLVQDQNDKYLLLFSGGADTVTSVKKIAIRDILNRLEKV